MGAAVTEQWPWDQPPDCVVITLRAIVASGAPILHVIHDLDDHGWQFLGWDTPEIDSAVVVSLARVARLDPSVVELGDLPPGWHAWRRLGLGQSASGDEARRRKR